MSKETLLGVLLMSRVIGITGSIAVGKSTVTQYLRTHGYCVLDADEISHQALEKESGCYQKIVDAFDCLDENQNISRQKLGQIVFHDANKKALLESIIHPYVKMMLEKGIQECQDPLVFLDVPLLYETHMDVMCDDVIVVYVDEVTQMQRLMKRNHIDENQARLLMRQQISIEKKKELGDHIIDNRQNFEDLYQNIERVLKVLKDEIVCD